MISGTATRLTCRLMLGSFDLIICRAAFKNFSEPLQALHEMHRVLKPGGKALIMDLRRDASLEDIKTHGLELDQYSYSEMDVQAVPAQERLLER